MFRTYILKPRLPKIRYFILVISYFPVFSLFISRNIGFPAMDCLIYPPVFWNGTLPISQWNIVSTKEYMIWSNLNSSYHQLIPLNGTGSVSLYGSGIAREYCRFIHVKDIYCSSRAALASPDKQVRLYPDSLKLTRQLNTSIAYDHVIYLYSEWGFVFAHFVHDSLAALMGIPEDIVEKSVIMASFDINVTVQYFELLGFPREKIIVDFDNWYYAKNLYVYYSEEPHNGYNMISFPKVANILRDKLNVNEIKGSRYVIMNRPNGSARYIKNINYLFKQTKKLYPKVKWELEELNYSVLSVIARKTATYKMWVTPSGSNTIYMIFMNRKYQTGICILQSKRIDFPNYVSAINCEIWMNGVSHNFLHHSKMPHNCNVPYTLTCIGRLLHALEKGEWPREAYNDSMEAFNFTDLYSFMKKHPKQVRGYVFMKDHYSYPLRKFKFDF